MGKFPMLKVSDDPDYAVSGPAVSSFFGETVAASFCQLLRAASMLTLAS